MSVALRRGGRRGRPTLPSLALRRRVAAVPAYVRIAALLAGLTGISLALRTTALHAGFWIDEGIAVGLADRSLSSIPSVLRLDGSPPAYYLLLGLWIDVFGDGQATTHVLSLLWALVSIPLGFWAARSLAGPRAGWICAALFALNPFLTYYAQETRMYTMMATLSLAVTACFAHAYVLRRRRFIAPFVLGGALVAYTHNWGLFLLVGCAAALVPVWRATTAEDRRALVRDVLIGFGAIGVLYLPWLPTVIVQAQTTGAPWALPPGPQKIVENLALVLGGAAVPLALLLAVGAGVSTIRRGPAPAIDGAVRAPRHVLIAVLIVVPVATMAVAYLVALASSAWALRYFAVMVGPLLLLAAVSLSSARRLGIVALACILALWFNPRTGELETKSNARLVAAEIKQSAYPGDLIVNVQPEQTPVVRYYLPPGLRYADAIGMVGDPGVFDWRDALERLRAARPTPTLESYVSSMRPGQTLFLTLPVIRGSTWRAPWTSLVRRRSAQWTRAANRNPLLERVLITPRFQNRRTLPRGLRVVLFRRLAAPRDVG